MPRFRGILVFQATDNPLDKNIVNHDEVEAIFLTSVAGKN